MLCTAGMQRYSPSDSGSRILATLVNAALLFLGGSAWADEPTSGFYADGVGLEISGSIGLPTSPGAWYLTADEPRPEWQLALRVRIGKFLSIGVSGEVVIGVSEGNEQSWKRQEVGVDLEWRFWGYRGIVRPWVGAGMAWGNVEIVGTDEYYRFARHFWEFLRLAAGCDVLMHPNLVPDGVGPHAFATRFGRGVAQDDRDRLEGDGRHPLTASLEHDPIRRLESHLSRNPWGASRRASRWFQEVDPARGRPSHGCARGQSGSRTRARRRIRR